MVPKPSMYTLLNTAKGVLTTQISLRTPLELAELEIFGALSRIDSQLVGSSSLAGRYLSLPSLVRSPAGTPGPSGAVFARVCSLDQQEHRSWTPTAHISLVSRGLPAQGMKRKPFRLNRCLRAPHDAPRHWGQGSWPSCAA